MSPRLSLAAVVILLALPSAPASAQRRAKASVDLRWRLAAVAANSPLRLSLGGAQIEGRARRVVGDTVHLAVDGGPVLAVPVSQVDTIWTRRRNAVRGAGIGAVAGALGLSALGHSFVTGMCETAAGCGREAREAALGGAVIGAAGGALLGAAIGSFVKTWRRVGP